MVLPVAFRAPGFQTSGIGNGPPTKLPSRPAPADSHTPGRAPLRRRGAPTHHAALAASAPPLAAGSQGHEAATLLRPATGMQAQKHANGKAAAHGSSEEPGELPSELLGLLDPSIPVRLPPSHTRVLHASHGKKLDQLVAQLGRSKATWRRALVLYEWLKDGPQSMLMDARLCTTLIRVCAQQRDATSALAIYDWMRAPKATGGGGLQPTVFTYSEMLRATLAARLLDRGMQVWQDARVAGVPPDSHMCIAYMELCTRLHRTDQALAVYAQMRAAPAGSAMTPTAHAYTAAMKAACEGGLWARALEIWGEMEAAGCPPSAHAFTAAMRACAAGCDWPRALSLFRDMTQAGIKPDVVSCTALMKALASTGEADKAEAVLQWMLREGMAPNVNAYTVLMTAMGNAKQWGRAVELLYKMQLPEWGQVQPNAYTYSVLIKLLGDHQQWQLAEAVFGHAEQQVHLARHQQHQQQHQQVAAGSFGVSPRGATALPNLTAPAAAGAGAGVATATASTGAQAQGQGGSGAWSRPSQLNGISWDLPQAQGTPSPSTGTRPPGSSFSLFSGTEATSSAAPTPAALSSTSPSTPASSPFPTSAASPAMTTLQRPSRPHHGAAASASLSSIDDWQSTPAAPAQQQQQQPQGPASSGVAEGLNLPADLDSPGPSMSLDAVDQALGQVQGQGQGRGQGQGQGQGFLWPPEQQQPRQQQGRHHSQAQAQQPIVNAVVCGALMHGYEQAGMWAEAVGVLSRARALGVEPNTVMFNTAIAAAGKAGQLQVCEQLFAMVTQPDLVTFETMINAYGYSGQPGPAERVYQSMLHAGFTRPRDYAYCGLIAAYTLAGDIDRALAVRQRARRAGGGEQLSLCVYNALLAACRRGQRAEAALSLLAEMKRQGLEPDAVTSQLMSEVGRQGVQSVEREQAALAAISAAMAAAGGLLIQRGLF